MIFGHATRSIVLAGLVAVAGTVMGTGQARAACGTVPDVPWWNAKTHDAITKEVKDRYRGDWALYQDVWQKFKARLETLQREGAAVRIGAGGEVLRDESLRRHIGEVNRRISVIRCLAGAYASTGPDEQYNAFETASGGGDFGSRTSWPSMSAQNSTTNVPSLTAEGMGLGAAVEPEVKIVTQCLGTTTKFRITNLGDKWPGVAKFLVHRKGDGQLLSERQLRMGSGQTVSFNIQDTSANNGLLELRVVPTWAPESSRNAVAKCT